MTRLRRRSTSGKTKEENESSPPAGHPTFMDVFGLILGSAIFAAVVVFLLLGAAAFFSGILFLGAVFFRASE